MLEESTFPKSSFIKLSDSKKTFFYKIIKEGTYPLTEQLYYTRYLKYPISHNYVVRTQYGKSMHTVKCSIEYVEKRPLYKVCFGVNFTRKVQSWKSSTDTTGKYYQEFNEIKEMGKNRNQSNKENKGKMSGPLLFGLKLLSIEQHRKILGLSQCVLDIVEKEKSNTFHPDDQIRFKQIKFETSEDLYNINFGTLDKIKEVKKIETIVKSIDKGHISREAYQSLARIEDLLREEAVYDIHQKINAEMKKKVPTTLVELLQPTVFKSIIEEPDITDSAVILNMLKSIKKKDQHRIADILNCILPLYIEEGILIPKRSTLNIQISGDGCNMRRKLKHVMIIMTLLNDLNSLQKPDNHHTLVLFPNAETYESLKNALTPLISDLCTLKERGFK
ncbi:hypothetical protein GLOIN_2v1521868 [Rhizophagus clarus]|uniref:Uncharacterized protein n=1 Tax=Rhizophagus clarus TaxID=94130 RepID=A0A8H3QE89_9GLOM|nr:hypothetical protein GLOIN_2v1521868 [Rhizophagus clarus]